MYSHIEEAKTRARLLQQFLEAKGLKLGHSESLEALAAMEGQKDWNTLNAGLKNSAETQGLFCPHCGHRGKVKKYGGAYVEQGPWNGKEYIFEGDATHYRCDACGGQFLDWSVDPLYEYGNHAIVLLKQIDAQWEARVVPMQQLAIALEENDLAGLNDFLEGASYEDIAGIILGDYELKGECKNFKGASEEAALAAIKGYEIYKVIKA